MRPTADGRREDREGCHARAEEPHHRPPGTRAFLAELGLSGRALRPARGGCHNTRAPAELERSRRGRLLRLETACAWPARRGAARAGETARGTVLVGSVGSRGSCVTHSGLVKGGRGKPRSFERRHTRPRQPAAVEASRWHSPTTGTRRAGKRQPRAQPRGSGTQTHTAGRPNSGGDRGLRERPEDVVVRG